MAGNVLLQEGLLFRRRPWRSRACSYKAIGNSFFLECIAKGARFNEDRQSPQVVFLTSFVARAFQGWAWRFLPLGVLLSSSFHIFLGENSTR